MLGALHVTRLGKGEAGSVNRDGRVDAARAAGRRVVICRVETHNLGALKGGGAPAVGRLLGGQQSRGRGGGCSVLGGACRATGAFPFESVLLDPEANGCAVQLC